ncbi:alpha/beta hydrolase [Novosphingobium sp. BL-8H]|uniref:alpha/beta fold hydrolase n=1 Tax=Novosphingobium sp. BL-8H TaxID=3127640 RepID=UPI0037584A02
MKLLYVHGWGFDRNFWQPLAALLADFDGVIDDRGYFGAPFAPEVDGPCIAVTHSFGTIRVLADPPPGLVGVVAINGFARFTAPLGQPGVPVRVVEHMIRRFGQMPAGVLASFHQQIGGTVPEGKIDTELLRRDLLRLRDARAPLPKVPVISLQGGQDPLLPGPMRATTFDGAPVRRIESEAGGHLLPVEDPELCAEAVRGLAAMLTPTGLA